MKQKNIGIVISKINEEITSLMLEAAKKEAQTRGVKVQEVIWVTGAFEIPFAAKQLLKRKNISGVATLGAIITGGTGHDQMIAHAVARKLLDLSMEFDKPVSLGIIGPKVTKKQAEERAVPYAKQAVRAVVLSYDPAGNLFM